MISVISITTVPVTKSVCGLCYFFNGGLLYYGMCLVKGGNMNVKNKLRCLFYALLLCFGVIFCATPVFAEEELVIETNGIVSFYGEVDYEGDPKPEPPTIQVVMPKDEQKPQQPDGGPSTKPGGKLPQLNQISNVLWLVGIIFILFVTRKVLRNKKNNVQLQLSNERNIRTN